MLFAGIRWRPPHRSAARNESSGANDPPINLSNYSLSNDADHMEWLQLVASFRTHSSCMNTGLLERHADYLYHRTGGPIASLGRSDYRCRYRRHRLRTEAITLDLLDSIAIDDVDPGGPMQPYSGLPLTPPRTPPADSDCRYRLPMKSETLQS